MILSRRSELSAALASCRSAFLGVAVFTALLNVLYLTGSFFMLQIYDRVLPSRSVPTLVALCILAAALYGFQAVLDIARSRVLSRIGGAFVEHRHVHGAGVAPEPGQRPAAFRELLAGKVPALAPHDQARPRPVARDPVALDGVGDRHRYPSSLATFWNQTTSSAGM